MTNSDFRFDKRVIERNLRLGLVTPEEYRKHIASLKDLSTDSGTFDAKLIELNRKVPSRPMEDEEEDL